VPQLNEIADFIQSEKKNAERIIGKVFKNILLFLHDSLSLTKGPGRRLVQTSQIIITPSEALFKNRPHPF
jgi:hypothetical protein